MSFVGKLDLFKLPDLLQIISGNRKTGRLALTRRDSQGVIVFRSGQIIYAASTAARETLGSLLLCRQLIDEEGLARALEIQHTANEEKRLGTILVEIGLLSEEALRQVITGQIEGVIADIMQWDGGFFKFDLLRLADHGEVEVDAQDFVHREGLSAQKVLIDIAAEMDRTASYPIALPAPGTEPEPGAGAAAGAPSRIGSLKSIMSAIRSPEFTGEATAQILGFARESLPRGALFVVRRDGFRAISTFGGRDGSDGRPARRLSLPLDQPSVIAEAADRQEAYRGPLEDNPANRTLLAALGDEQPTEVVGIPLVVNDLALLVLYGDNGSSGEPIAQIDQLELLMLQAGLAMERHLLRKRLDSLEERKAR